MNEVANQNETSGQFLQRLGMDGKLWAEEMHKKFPSIPEDELLGWCCNMIMAGYDEAMRREQKQRHDESSRASGVGEEGAEEYSDLMDKCYSAFGIGKHARSERTLLANIENAARRSCCLSFIEGFLETVTPDEDGDCPLNWGDLPEVYLEKFKAVWSTRPKQESIDLSELRNDRVCIGGKWFVAANTEKDPYQKWQPVKGWEGIYEVHPVGVIRKKNGAPLKQWENSGGYMLVRLSQPRKVERVHRIVAEAFIPNPLNAPTINHKDCNPANNQVENLEWCSQKDNLLHSRRLGRLYSHPKGKASPNRSLSIEEVQQIRSRRENLKTSYSQLATEYGVSKRCIGRIIKKEVYADV